MINLHAVTPLLSAGDLILTPNNRLKNKLFLAWAQTQAGVAAPPNVLSLSDWIAQRWERLQRSGDPATQQPIASHLVRRQLWAQVINASDTLDPLVHPRLLIDQLDQAYSYLRLWQVTTADWRAYGQVLEQQRLQLWIDAFEQHLALCGLLSEEQRLSYLLAQLTAHSDIAARVHLLNFDTLAPLHKQLLNTAFDAVHHHISNQRPARDAKRVVCKDPKQEMQAAAHWAYQQLSSNPDQRIAIVDPNLGQHRARLERHLAQVFEPEHALPHCPRYTMPFNFSAGTPLAQCPVIHQLLATLRWPKPAGQCLAWLNSPFMGHEDDQATRHWVGAMLLESGAAHISLAHIEQVFTAAAELAGQVAHTEDAAPGLSFTAMQPWRLGLAQLTQWPAKATGRQWARQILATLALFNWPGPRPLDSEEHQQVSQLLQLLEQLVEADQLGQPLSAQEASHWLAELASRQPFQPQTPESPLQVLGALESAGLAFDQIWVLGLDDTQWPPAAAPNPLLPAQLQRDLHMPHAGAEKELDFCQRLTQNFLHAADTVIFSHPARDGDRELSPSPLIAHLPLGPEPQIPETSPGAAALEWLDTMTAPPISPTELANLRGGSSLLQKQARCPLAAFMEVRLGARRPEPAQPGLNALDRGNLLHQALFYFWRAKPDVRSLDEAALEAALNAALDAACNEFPALVNTRFMALERTRLMRLLRPWIAYEQARPAFQVHSLEQSLQFTLGPLPLTLRLDRIDLVDGQWLLIDYKSGTTHLNAWLGERPEEPQLPLYAVALSDAGEPVAAIAFAELRQKNQFLQGVGNSHLAEGVLAVEHKNIGADSWPALLEHWRLALLNLAEELVNGRCPLVFSSPQSAQYLAHLSPLLRLPEQAQLTELTAVAPEVQRP